MPAFDMECPRCKHTWEALIIKTTDGHLKMCPKCATPGEQQVSTKVDWTIWGFSARNNYGLKKFDDGR